jgi:hypothetical protein
MLNGVRVLAITLKKRWISSWELSFKCMTILISSALWTLIGKLMATKIVFNDSIQLE